MSERTRKLALTEGVTAGILFGTAAIFIRFLNGINAFSIAFWRLVTASIALSIMLLVLRKSFSLRIIRKNLKDLSLMQQNI